MSAALKQILRSRWFMFCLQAALWTLLYLGIVSLRGKVPALGQGGAVATTTQPTLPVRKLGPLFADGLLRQNVFHPTNIPDPFFTRYFVPPAPPPPPPPTTRKLPVTYLGFFQTTNGPRQAVLNLAGGLMVVQVGALVATNVYVAEASLQSVLLTNTAAKTNSITLNTKMEIEVPIR